MESLQKRVLRVLALFSWSVVVLSLIRAEYVLWNLNLLKNSGAVNVMRAFLHGLRFDLAASAWLILPLMLFALIPWPAKGRRPWEGVVLGVFLLSQFPFWLLNLIDVEFVNFVGRRMTLDVLFILGEARGKVGGFLSAYGLLILWSALMLGIFVVGTILIFQLSRNIRVKPGWRIWRKALLSFGVLGFLVIATRGGVQNKPLHLVNAQVFSEGSLNLVVLNSTFTVLKSIGKKEVEKYRFFGSLDELKPFLNGSVPGKSLLEGHRPPAPQNVVIIILESFGQEYMGRVNGLTGYTPFLDSLAENGLFFRNGFANGRRSIEGIPAVLSGMPALMNEPFVTSPFSNGDFPGLGRLLEGKVNETAFFHGGRNGTMHFDSYSESAGFKKYFGASEYPNPERDDDGVWGIYDGPMLLWTKDRFDEMKQPFLAAFFSLSSHNPYRIPEAIRQRFPEGPLPILKTIAYTDDALRIFFAEAAKSPWFQNTLFVITADHTFMPYLPRFDHEVGRYRVPILFYHPRMRWPKGIDRDQVVQQIDILPSVLDFLGLENPAPNLLARSVFVPGERTASVFVNGTAILFDRDEFLYWPPGKEPQLYSMEDPTRKNPLESEHKAKLENRLKASLQYFSESMHGNRWQ